MTERPLSGRRVVVTRAAHQAAGLAAAFEAAGAQVMVLPLLELAPPPDAAALERAARDAGSFDWLVFTSANAVEAFLPLVEATVCSRLRVAAVGPATAQALHGCGLAPALEARESRAEGLLESLRPRLGTAARVLIPQAGDARAELAEGLSAAGAEVSVVVAYDKRLPPAAAVDCERLFSTPPIGWVTFTSPRIARHFAALFGRAWGKRRGELEAISIGPVTTAELRRLGVEAVAEASEASDRGLVAAAVARARRAIPLRDGS